MFVGLLQNIALLVSLAVGLQMLAQRLEGRRMEFRMAAGLLFGLAGIVGMMTPVHFAPGVIYDGRSIVLTLAGFFGGPLAAVEAAVLCGGYRLYLGGAGAWVGTAVVVESAALGVVLRYLRKRDERWIRPLRLLLFGLLVHVGMLALQFLLPGGLGWEVLRSVGPVVLLGYPVAFLLAAHVFLEGERRRKGKRALAESEQRFKDLFLKSPVSIIIHDKDTGEIVDANPAACASYGLSTVEELRQNDFWLDPPYSFNEALVHIHKAAREGSHRVEWHGQRKKGELFWEIVFLSPINIDGVERILAKSIDITEQKNAERVLKQHSHLLEHSPNAVYVSDGVGRIIYANAAASRQTGHVQSELIGMSVFEIDSDFPKAEYETFLSNITMDETRSIWTTHQRVDGTHFPVEMSISKLELEGTSLLCGIARDMTEQDAKEVSLQRTQFSIDNAPFSIFWISREGRFIYVNNKAAQNLGYSREELIGLGVADIDPNFPSEKRESQWDLYKEREDIEFESLHLRKDGTTFLVHVNSYHLKFMGEEMEVAEVEDISERKKAEEALEGEPRIAR